MVVRGPSAGDSDQVSAGAIPTRDGLHMCNGPVRREVRHGPPLLPRSRRKLAQGSELLVVRVWAALLDHTTTLAPPPALTHSSPQPSKPERLLHTRKHLAPLCANASRVPYHHVHRRQPVAHTQQPQIAKHQSGKNLGEEYTHLRAATGGPPPRSRPRAWPAGHPRTTRVWRSLGLSTVATNP